MMVTHNMKDAIVHGNRLIMMYDGRIVIDVSGEEKKKLTVPDLLALFSKVSGSDESRRQAAAFLSRGKPDSNCMLLPSCRGSSCPDFIFLKQQKDFVQNHG